jgi:hypothetical protein
MLNNDDLIRMRVTQDGSIECQVLPMLGQTLGRSVVTDDSSGPGEIESLESHHMRTLTLGLVISSLAATASACHSDSSERDDKAPAPLSLAHRSIPQVMPPLDIKEPPDDAMKTSSGLVYKKLATKNDGARAQRGDKVLVHYTGWRQRTGETFFTTRGTSQPQMLDVDHAAPAFRQALQLLHKGEKAVLWVPPGDGATDMLVYEVQVVDVVPPPAVATNARAAAGMAQDSLAR